MENLEPLVSVIIPTKNSSKTLERCLDSVKNQTYKNIELIVVSKEKIDLNVGDANIKVFEKNDLNKTEARNFGVSASNGQYILHIDGDMYLNDFIIQECIDSKKDIIVIPEIDKGISFINKIRSFEYKLILDDYYVESPRFFKKDIFLELGGFDNDLDPMDEQSIGAKIILKKYNIERIKSSIYVESENSLIEIAKRKFYRGQVSKLFKLKYKNYKQFNVIYRGSSFLKKIKKISNISDFIIFIFLILLKIYDWFFFYLGSLFPNKTIRNTLKNNKNSEIFNKEGDYYEKKFFKNSVGGEYVDSLEKDIVLKILKELNFSENIRILDLGMGPGRWSRLMLENFPNSEVYGVDLSSKMVEAAKNNLSEFGGRFFSINASMDKIPFEDNFFDIIVNIRAIKYLNNYNDVISEMFRVSKNNAINIVEFPKTNIYLKILKIIPLKLFGDYINRIKSFSIKDIKNIFQQDYSYKVYFTIPATLYAKINNNFILLCFKNLEKILPKNIFGRSIFVKKIINKNK